MSRVVVHPTLPTLFSITIHYIRLSEAVPTEASQSPSKRFVGRDDVSPLELS